MSRRQRSYLDWIEQFILIVVGARLSQAAEKEMFGKCGASLGLFTRNSHFEGARLQPCRHVCVGSWASAPEGIRTSCQHRSPSVAKAAILRAAYGTAEAVP